MLSVPPFSVSVLSLVAGALNVFSATWCSDVAETWNSVRKGPQTQRSRWRIKCRKSAASRLQLNFPAKPGASEQTTPILVFRCRLSLLSPKDSEEPSYLRLLHLDMQAVKQRYRVAHAKNALLSGTAALCTDFAMHLVISALAIGSDSSAQRF